MNRRKLLTGTVASMATAGAAPTEAEAPAQMEAMRVLDALDLDAALLDQLERLEETVGRMRGFFRVCRESRFMPEAAGKARVADMEIVRCMLGRAAANVDTITMMTRAEIVRLADEEPARLRPTDPGNGLASGYDLEMQRFSAELPTRKA